MLNVIELHPIHSLELSSTWERVRREILIGWKLEVHFRVHSSCALDASLAIWITSAHSQYLTLKYNKVLSLHLSLGLQSALFPSNVVAYLEERCALLPIPDVKIRFLEADCNDLKKTMHVLLKKLESLYSQRLTYFYFLVNVWNC